MDQGFPSEQSSLPYSTYDLSDADEDYSAHQYQAELYSGNFQGNGTEASPIAPGSYPHPFYQNGPWDESEYLPIQQSVPSAPNDQFQLYLQPPSPSNDISHTHDPVLDSFSEGHLIDNNTRHLAPLQAHRASGSGWGSSKFRTVQEGAVDDLEAQGASGSDPPGSSSTTTSSLPGLYSQYRVQNGYTRAASSSRGQVEDAAQSRTVTQGQDAAKREVLRRRKEKKRERDRLRKEDDRAADDRAYSRVCNLLAVNLSPKKTRSKRILESVENVDQNFERMCELLEISMTPRETLARRILEGVEAMAARQKLDRDLRRELENSEAHVAFMKLTNSAFD